MFNKKYGYIYMVCLILVDLVSKFLINQFMPLGSKITIIPGFFALLNVHNTGAAFSIFEGMTWILSIVSLVAGCFFVYYYIKTDLNKLTFISLILMTAGTFGNFYDRLFLSYVRDFLSFNIFGYPFAVFNFADSFLVIGVFILGLDIFIKEFKHEKDNS